MATGFASKIGDDFRLSDSRLKFMNFRRRFMQGKVALQQSSQFFDLLLQSRQLLFLSRRLGTPMLSCNCRTSCALFSQGCTNFPPIVADHASYFVVRNEPGLFEIFNFRNTAAYLRRKLFPIEQPVVVWRTACRMALRF
jgi:hypothetical protein